MSRFLVFSFLGLLIVAVSEWDIHKRIFPPFRALDKFWVEFCIGNSADNVGQPSISVVRITEQFKPVSFSDAEMQTNVAKALLSRLDYATFLYSLSKLNTRSVAFFSTPDFADDSALNSASIFPLKNASLRLPKMVVATVVSSDGPPQGEKQSVQYQALAATGDLTALPEITRTSMPADPEVLVNGESAFVRIENHTLSGARVQLIARQGDKVVAGFIVAAVARESNIPYSQIKVDLESSRPVIEVGDLYRIPIAKDGTMTLPSQAGLSDTMYTVAISEQGKEIRDYRFASIEADKLAIAVEQSSEIGNAVYHLLESQVQSLSQNLVLIGVDRSADRTIETAAGEFLSPLTAAARAIATIQSKRHTSLWPIWCRALCYVAIFLIAAILLRFGRVSAFLTPLVLVFFLAILVVIFRQTLSWVPISATLAMFTLLFLVALTAKSKRRKADEELEPQSIVA